MSVRQQEPTAVERKYGLHRNSSQDNIERHNWRGSNCDWVSARADEDEPPAPDADGEGNLFDAYGEL